MNENEPQEQLSSEVPPSASIPIPAEEPIDPQPTPPPTTDMPITTTENIEPVSESVENIPQESAVVSYTPEPAIEDIQNTNADAVKETRTSAHESTSIPKQNTIAEVSESSTQNIFRGKEGRMRALEKKNAKREIQLQQILEHVRVHASITNNAVEKLLRISDATASRYLKLLVDRGLLTRTGKGRAVVYVANQ